MAEWLLLRLARDPEADATWIVADDTGRIVMQAQRGSLDAAAPLAAGRRVCVLVPAADVLVTEASVPRGGGKLQQVVPFALEEQLADDVEDLHFALGRRGADAVRVPVAVVARSLLDGWLARIRAARLEPQALYADSELLPQNPAQAIALLEGDDAIVRLPGASPVVMPVDALPEVFEPPASASNQPAPDPHELVVYADPDEWERYAALVDALRQRFDGIKVQLLTGGVLSLFAQQLQGTAAINLLQGSYAPKSSLTEGWRAWRVAAILAACLFGLHVAGKAVELGALGRTEQRVDASIEEAFRQAMPGEQNTVDARRRMEQRLMAMRTGGTTTGLLPALGALAQARGNVPGTTVRSLNFREGTLELTIVAPNADALDRLTQMLRAEGWQADLTSGSTTESGYEGRMQLRAAGRS